MMVEFTSACFSSSRFHILLPRVTNITVSNNFGDRFFLDKAQRRLVLQREPCRSALLRIEMFNVTILSKISKIRFDLISGMDSTVQSVI